MNAREMNTAVSIPTIRGFKWSIMPDEKISSNRDEYINHINDKEVSHGRC
jgi:hypothetical protein